MSDRADIRQYLELEISLDHGLQLEPVRAMAGIAKENSDRVALSHIAARDVDGKRLPAWTGTHATAGIVY